MSFIFKTFFAALWLMSIAILVTGHAVADDTVYVSPNGNMGIGTSNPDEKLTVNNGRVKTRLDLASDRDHFQLANDDGAVFGRIGLKSSSANLFIGSDVYQDVIVIGRATGGVGMATASPDPAFQLDVNGEVRGSYWSDADLRLKEDIKPVDNALLRISRLRGVSYRWKDSARGLDSELGVIAQEVENQFPEAVLTDSKGYKAVSYGCLVAPLIEAIKELKNENQDLKSQIANLDARLKQMEQNQNGGMP